MRIVHVVPRGEQPWSGILTVIVNLSASLSRQGNHVEVWQLHRWRPDTYAEQQQILGSAGVVQLSPAADEPWWRLGRSVADLVQRRKPHIVHLHGAFNPWNTLVAQGLSRPYVFSPHSGYDPVSLRRGSVRKSVYGWLFERQMLDRAALCVALSEVERSQLRAFGARGPVTVIPNGVGPPLDAVNPLSFRAELGIGPDTPLAVFVGRLDVYRKGLDILVRSIASIPEWHLALVGPPFRDVKVLSTLITDLRINDRVHEIGALDGRGVHQALAAADVFVLLSRWEGMPMALLEALSHGTPAVVSSAVERLIGIQAAGAGWVADENSIEAVLGQVLRTGTDELRRYQEAAASLASRYRWATVAKEYAVAYEHARGSGTIAEP
jgi:glycosyltransferase involved in cell wall biosynthesis